MDALPPNLADRAETQMRALILGGALKPGERIFEAATAKRMGISRAPLREALRRLEAQGLVIAVPGQGVFVRAYTPEDVWQVAELRRCLQQFAVGALVALPDVVLPDLAERLAALEADFARAFANPRPGALIEANLAFHVGLVRLTGNARLAAAFEPLAAELRLIHSLSQSEQDPSFLNPRTYSPLIGRIVARDGAGAEAEIGRLIRGFASKAMVAAGESNGGTSSPRRKASSERS